MATRLRHEISQPTVLNSTTRAVSIGATFGMAVTDDPHFDPAELLRQADQDL